MAKRRRGLGGTAYTKGDLKSQAKSCGSHYFDPSSMRFFNARLIAVYPVPGKNVTYFVEGKGGSSRGMFQSIKRHYTVERGFCQRAGREIRHAKKVAGYR